MSAQPGTAIVVMTTLPGMDDAEKLARILVEGKLAACVQVIPGIQSVYMWEGSIQMESEVLVVIKTLSDKFIDIEDCIKKNHPYTVPEILAIPTSEVTDDYLKWMSSVV
jgi:periplasmic divalent cation tolerance protein